MSIAQNTRDKAALIQKEMTLTKEGEAGFLKSSDDVYSKVLDEGVTTDMVKKVKANDTNFVNAFTLAVSNVALDAIKEDKNLKTIEAKAKMGYKDTVAATWEKEHTFHNPANNEKIVKNGVIVTKVKTQAGSKGAELTSIRNEGADKVREMMLKNL